MDLTDQEWLLEIAKAFDGAYRYPDHCIRVSDELAKQLSERMREIADRLETEEALACES